ncbi:Gfo/Idh/MocA family oxidoreductase [Cohnella herbarum]|uniref:Gfo/Idh/MocA-like oxidoreductase N-terminal domain-containing protein n=1 Tax=Cohnella herbarum TaxID=2728023 RepID=A0A7Z2VIW6_9BACL|nr:Gfo/Idh/MocA family oxidoreductase [Cohnella herbarum]QJD83877.1 hypothetical protein HH215_12250 [Cohnella herbarum]
MTRNDNIGMGFIGAGTMGTIHMETFLRMPGVELAAVADVSAARAEQVAAPTRFTLSGDRRSRYNDRPGLERKPKSTFFSADNVKTFLRKEINVNSTREVMSRLSV